MISIELIPIWRNEMRALLFSTISLVLLLGMSVRGDTVANVEISLDEANVDSALLPVTMDPALRGDCNCAINQMREMCFAGVPSTYVTQGCCGSKLSLGAPADVVSKVNACMSRGRFAF